MSEPCIDCDQDALGEDPGSAYCQWQEGNLPCLSLAAQPLLEMSVIPPGFRYRVDVEVALCYLHQQMAKQTGHLKVDWSVVLLALGQAEPA